MTNKEIISVTEGKFHELLYRLFFKIERANVRLDYVVGIERGGLNVSIPLAKLLNLPHKSIGISFYNEENTANAEPIVDFHGHVFKEDDYILVVDDLIDEGHTLNYLINNVNCKHYIAVLYWNKYGKFGVIPDFYVETKYPSQWLEFYWEKK